MDIELQNKWAEVIEINFNNKRIIEEYEANNFAELPQTVKNNIFNTFINDFVQYGIYNRDELRQFVKQADLDKPIYHSTDFDFTLNKHFYNIRGISKYLVLSILYKWPELFNKAVDELNNYVINSCKRKAEISFNFFTKDEIKEYVKLLIDKISSRSDFIELYDEWVAPYKLK